MGRARSSSHVQKQGQNSVRAQHLSSSHPPSPWQRTRFWTGLTRFESKSKILLWDVSPSKSPSSHPINKLSRSWHDSEQWSQVCWVTPKRKGVPRDTKQQTAVRNTLCKMPQASGNAGNTGLVVLGGFLGWWGKNFLTLFFFLCCSKAFLWEASSLWRLAISFSLPATLN